MQLTPVELRVLGSLIEKEIATPEYYPLSLNALVAACNQRSSRDPVMSITDDEARGALRSLEDADLVSVDHGSRVQRYEHRARTVFHLRRDETAVLCLLLLRGPQTPGELRSRSDRLHPFDDIASVTSTLARLAAPAELRPEPIVVQIARQPGTKEQRYEHVLGGVPDVSEGAVSSQSSVETAESSLLSRVERLEAEVASLRSILEQLT